MASVMDSFFCEIAFRSENTNEHVGAWVQYLAIFKVYKSSKALNNNRSLRKFVLNIPIYGQLRKLGQEALQPECDHVGGGES